MLRKFAEDFARKFYLPMLLTGYSLQVSFVRREGYVKHQFTYFKSCIFKLWFLSFLEPQGKSGYKYLNKYINATNVKPVLFFKIITGWWPYGKVRNPIHCLKQFLPMKAKCVIKYSKLFSLWVLFFLLYSHNFHQQAKIFSFHLAIPQ